MKLLRHASCFVLLAAAAFAAAPSTASIDRLLTVTEAEKLLTSIHQQVEAMLQSGLRQGLAGKPMTPEVRQFVETFQKRMVADLKEEISWERMKAIYLSVYSETFTQEEVDGLIAFYESPTGKAFVAKMPIVMQKSMVAMQERMGPMMKKMDTSMREAIKEAQTLRDKPAQP